MFSAFIFAGLVFTLGRPEWFPESYFMPRAMGYAAFIYAFIVILPRLIFRLPDGEDPHTGKKQKALVNFQMAIAFCLYFDSIGALGFFHLQRLGIQYDKLVHFVVPTIFTFVGTDFIHNWFGLKFRKALVIALSLVIFGGVMWELLEFSSDVFFGTRRFGVYGQNVINDTILDMSMNAMGIVTGSVASVVRNKRNNSTMAAS